MKLSKTILKYINSHYNNYLRNNEFDISDLNVHADLKI